MTKFLQKIIAFLVATAYVAVMFFCLNAIAIEHSLTNNSCCAPTTEHSTDSEHHSPHALEHLQHWQSIFATNISVNNNLLLSMLLIVAALGVSLLFPHKFEWIRQFHYFDSRLYRLRNINSKLFDVILQAISRGILNPRLYNPIFVIN